MDENGMSNIISALITKNGDAFGGANGSWLIIFFFMMMFWGGFGGGWGNNGVATAAAMQNTATQQDIFNSINTNNITAQLQGINQSINQLGYNQLAQMGQLGDTVMQGNFGIQQQIGNTGNGIMAAIAQSAFADQRGMDGINRNIDQLRYDGALRACDIKETGNAGTQRVLDRIGMLETNMDKTRIQELTTANQALQLQISTLQQTNNLIAALGSGTGAAKAANPTG